MLRTKIKNWLKSWMPAEWVYGVRYFFLPRKMKGRQQHCPICNYRFSEFLPAGIENKPNRLCAVCYGLERNRMFYLYFRDHTDLFTKPVKLLHVAPETSLMPILQRQKNIDYVSADLFASWAIKKWDITDLPVDDNSYDVIICSHVLEHIVDDRKAMREIQRVLRPSGWALLHVPMKDQDKTYEDASITSPEERLKAFGQQDHVRKYGRDFVDRLKESGLVVEVKPVDRLFSAEEITRYAIREKEQLYICKKGQTDAE